jgi:hypothetical protein
MSWSFAYEFVAQGIWDAEDFEAFVLMQCGAIFMAAWKQATSLAKTKEQQ